MNYQSNRLWFTLLLGISLTAITSIIHAAPEGNFEPINFTPEPSPESEIIARDKEASRAIAEKLRQQHTTQEKNPQASQPTQHEIPEPKADRPTLNPHGIHLHTPDKTTEPQLTTQTQSPDAPTEPVSPNDTNPFEPTSPEPVKAPTPKFVKGRFNRFIQWLNEGDHNSTKAFLTIFKSDQTVISNLFKEAIDNKQPTPDQQEAVQQKIKEFSTQQRAELFSEITEYELKKSTTQQSKNILDKNQKLFQQLLPNNEILLPNQSSLRQPSLFTIADLTSYNPNRSIEQNCTTFVKSQDLRVNMEGLQTAVRSYLQDHPTKKNLQALIVDDLITGNSNPLEQQTSAIRKQFDMLSAKDSAELLTKITERQISAENPKMSASQTHTIYAKDAQQFQRFLPENQILIPIENAAALNVRATQTFEIIDVSSIAQKNLALYGPSIPEEELSELAKNLKTEQKLKLSVSEIADILKQYITNKVQTEAEQHAKESMIAAQQRTEQEQVAAQQRAALEKPENQQMLYALKFKNNLSAADQKLLLSMSPERQMNLFNQWLQPTPSEDAIDYFVTSINTILQNQPEDIEYDANTNTFQWISKESAQQKQQDQAKAQQEAEKQAQQKAAAQRKAEYEQAIKAQDAQRAKNEQARLANIKEQQEARERQRIKDEQEKKENSQNETPTEQQARQANEILIKLKQWQLLSKQPSFTPAEIDLLRNMTQEQQMNIFNEWITSLKTRSARGMLNRTYDQHIQEFVEFINTILSEKEYGITYDADNKTFAWVTKEQLQQQAEEQQQKITLEENQTLLNTLKTYPRYFKIQLNDQSSKILLKMNPKRLKPLLQEWLNNFTKNSTQDFLRKKDVIQDFVTQMNEELVDKSYKIEYNEHKKELNIVYKGKAAPLTVEAYIKEHQNVERFQENVAEAVEKIQTVLESKELTLKIDSSSPASYLETQLNKCAALHYADLSREEQIALIAVAQEYVSNPEMFISNPLTVGLRRLSKHLDTAKSTLNRTAKYSHDVAQGTKWITREILRKYMPNANTNKNE